MMHVGNDIVDMSSPYVKGKSDDRKFVQRVLTPREHQVLMKSHKQDSLLQLFWAAKETAYKITAKICPAVSSAPRRYDVCLDTPESGKDIRGRVTTPFGLVHVRALQNQAFIHCFGAQTSPAAKTVRYGIETINDLPQPDFCRSSKFQSRMVRASARRKIASALSLSENDVTITNTGHEKHSLFPVVYINGEESGISISLSHDGRFLAYAFLIQHEASP